MLRLLSKVLHILHLSLVIWLTTARPGHAQTGRSTIVSPAEAVSTTLAVGYDPEQERVWCVTQFDTTATLDYALVTVLAVEPSKWGSRNKVEDVGSACPAGQPMIHTHSVGNCQASPKDKEASMVRGARFDGIMCGDRFIVWYFSEELTALNTYDFLKGLRQ